jgi:hypothetical protein
VAKHPNEDGSMSVTGEETLSNGTACRVKIDVPPELFVEIDWSKPGASLDRITAKNAIRHSMTLAAGRATEQAIGEVTAKWDERNAGKVEPDAARPWIDLVSEPARVPRYAAKERFA